MNWDRLWWSITCTIALWVCVAAALCALAVVIYGLTFSGLSGPIIFVIFVGVGLAGLTFAKAWSDYPQYNPGKRQ